MTYLDRYASGEPSYAAGNNGGLGQMSDTAIDNRKGLAGYEFDPILAADGAIDGVGVPLYHVRNRVLNSYSGKWMQKDPLGYHDSMDLYEYVRAKPLDLLDPSGLRSENNCRPFLVQGPRVWSNTNEGYGEWSSTLSGTTRLAARAVLSVTATDNSFGFLASGQYWTQRGYRTRNGIQPREDPWDVGDSLMIGDDYTFSCLQRDVIDPNTGLLASTMCIITTNKPTRRDYYKLKKSQWNFIFSTVSRISLAVTLDWHVGDACARVTPSVTATIETEFAAGLPLPIPDVIPLDPNVPLGSESDAHATVAGPTWIWCCKNVPPLVPRPLTPEDMYPPVIPMN